MAHPTGQLLRQIRPVAIPTSIHLQSPGVITTTPNISHTGIQHAQAPSSISTVPLLNNSSIRVRLPDTPTPPNILQHTTPIIQQHGRGGSIASNIPVSATTLMKPASTLVSASGQVQTSQQPTMVTIQGHQVIINPQVGQSPPTPGASTSGNSTLIASNNFGGGVAALRPSQQICSPTTTVVQQHAIVAQQKMAQPRPQQSSAGSSIVVGTSPNVFRVPTPSCGSSSAATVIVDASGVSGQATQLPHTVMVRLCIT